MIAAWSLYYLLNSLKFTLPWATCGNDWNTENCTVWNKGAVESCKTLNGTMLANGTCIYAWDAIRDTLNLSSLNTNDPSVYPSNGVMPSMEYFQLVFKKFIIK